MFLSGDNPPTSETNSQFLAGSISALLMWDRQLTAGERLEVETYLTNTYVAGSNAVPEPGQVAASLLLLAGLGGYALLKRRKKQPATAATA